MKGISRREFLEHASLIAAAAAALGTSSYAEEQPTPVKKVGPNDRLHVACIGFNGQGKSHIRQFASLPDTLVTHVCDVDSRLADQGIKLAAERQQREPVFVQDLRRIMEDKSIDIVSIATPNHWHALAAIWAIQAGKDVYVEKPVSHNVWEGRRIVDFARKHNRIVQTGTQSRSNLGMRQTIDYVQSGKIGKVTLAYGLCYKLRPSIGPRTETPVPPGVDYDLWLGPAPYKPVLRQRFHYDWHWFWDYGNGDLGNQGIHEMDKARWGLGKTTLPTSVFSFGGRFGYQDAGETANTQVCLFDYGDATLVFEVRGLPTKDFKGAKVGNVWIGSDGYVVSPSYDAGIVYAPDGSEVARFKGGGNHYANFVQAVRSRRYTDLTADIEEGHLSSALCHLGNISYRLGTVDTSAARERNLAEGKESLERMLDHLRDNQVDIETLPLRVGRKLRFDPAQERFLGDAEADQLLSREYRKGFEVPATT
jgi:predicted dehydrogenase